MYEIHIGGRTISRSGAFQTADPTSGRFVNRPSLRLSTTPSRQSILNTISMYIWRKRADGDWLRRQGEDLLCRFGTALASIERPGKAQTLLEVSCDTRNEAVQLRREFGGTIEKLRANWLEQLAKRTAAKRLRIGSRLVVSRTRDPARSGARTIVIPAEAAFGTGEHATTAMCLRMLERATRKREAGWSMLDAGTGTGILAIAGSCFGAHRVIAVDNDPMACATARRNAMANRVRNIDFRAGDVLKQEFRGKFAIITANLYSEILIAALPVWKRSLATDGCLILSGILRSQEQSVVASLHRTGLTVPETRRRGKWIALLAIPARKNS
jgi:ribosomal protein L11 methyltransferase